MKSSLWFVAAFAMLGSFMSGCQNDSSASNSGTDAPPKSTGNATDKTGEDKPIADPRTTDPSDTKNGEKADGSKPKPDTTAKKPGSKDFRMRPIESPTGGAKKTGDGPVGQFKTSIHLDKGIRTIVFGLMEDKTLIWTESVVGVEPEEPTKRFLGTWSANGDQITMEIDFEGKKEKLVGKLNERSLLIASYDKARYPVKSLEFHKR